MRSGPPALSHAMEDQVLAGVDQPVIIASFQRERFYRQEAHRYLRISEKTDQVYVLAALYQWAAAEGADLHQQRHPITEADRSSGSGVLAFLVVRTDLPGKHLIEPALLVMDAGPPAAGVAPAGALPP
mgnify:CR=1 FL=1